MSEKIDLRSLRHDLKWTQEQMAEYLGLDRSSVSRVENGQAIKGPTERLLRKLVEESVPRNKQRGRIRQPTFASE